MRYRRVRSSETPTPSATPPAGRPADQRLQESAQRVEDAPADGRRVGAGGELDLRRHGHLDVGRPGYDEPRAECLAPAEVRVDGSEERRARLWAIGRIAVDDD